MEALAGSLFAVVVLQFGLLWHKLGKLEQKIDNHCTDHLRK